MNADFPIPEKRNLCIASAQLIALLSLLWCSSIVHAWMLIPVSLGYGLVMNSAYAMLHEAEHGILHSNRKINAMVGVILALFFPAPFHLIRQGHLGHHLRNRSDDEAFDFYFDGENPLWKKMQLYGILTGFFWLVILLGNLLVILWPWYLQPRKLSLDRPTEAFLQSLNRAFLPLVWMESVMVIALHAALIWWWDIPFWHWFATLAGFGIMWSAMQYVHHFGTNRDVKNGALNLRTWQWLDVFWLHHNWHLRHHQHPTIPWIHLPSIEQGETEDRPSLFRAYRKMWRGPKHTTEHVENKYADRIIR